MMANVILSVMLNKQKAPRLGAFCLFSIISERKDMTLYAFYFAGFQSASRHINTLWLAINHDAYFLYV